MRREYLLSTGEKVVKKDGLYYLRGGSIVLNEQEMYQYCISQASTLEDPQTFPDTIRNMAEYNWKYGK